MFWTHKPKIRKAAYADPSAKEVGFAYLSHGTQRSDWGATRRAYRNAQEAISRANSEHAIVLDAWNELSDLTDEHHVDEFALALAPRLNHGISVGAVVVEFGLGAWLGWSLGGGDDPFLSGLGFVGPAVSALGFGGVFGLAGLTLAEGLGRSLARFLGRSDATNLLPTEDQVSDERISRGVVSRRRVGTLGAITGVALVGMGGYFLANTLRESLVETASIDVSPTAIAALGTIIPIGASVVKAHWYSREAAVRRHELVQQFVQRVRRWSKLHAQADRRRADATARFANIIASAALADANQSGSSAERIAELLDERMPLSELLPAQFPMRRAEALSAPAVLKVA